MQQKKINDKVMVKSVKFDVGKGIVLLDLSSTKRKSNIQIAIKSSQLPQSLGLGEPDVLYPNKIIQKICKTILNKELEWQSELDEAVHITKEEYIKYADILGRNPILDKESEESEGIRMQIEKKLESMEQYPLDAISRIKK